jgi:signal transduction histidine kinase
MILPRLGIRQKLGLLLLLPLLGVVLTLVPFASDRVGDARASHSTAEVARAARQLGGLVQDLQQERLLALAYLLAPSPDATAFLSQAQTVTAEAALLQADAGTRTEMATAAKALAALSDTRRRVVLRAVAPAAVYAAYRRAVRSLLDALALEHPVGVDVESLRKLAALDALMRTGEEASSVGAAMLVVAANGGGKPLLTAALAAYDHQAQRFRGLADAQEIGLVDLVENGKVGSRLRRLATGLTSSAKSTGSVRVADALAGAVNYTGLRRVAEERVVRGIVAAAERRATAGQAAAAGVAAGGVVLLVLVVTVSTIISRSVSRPLRRLTRAAGVVADLAEVELTRVADSDEMHPSPPRLAAVDIRSADEVGELAAAFNRVQATAALLLERQAATRRNVAVMFGNIARRTESLVGRQLALIDELEHNEQNADVLEKLYRADHVATRLRRSAECLLVVSGMRDDEHAATGPAPLADVIRSALAEIEGFRSVRLGAVCDVIVAIQLVPDLRLLLAELLENAASFSAPGTTAEVFAEFDGDCVISVVDHGIGMSATRLAEENRRLLERERIDIAPTSVLGLFVVGRLARRHGLSVRLAPTPGQGVTATVTVPAHLVSHRQPAGSLPAAVSYGPELIDPDLGDPDTGKAPDMSLPVLMRSRLSSGPFSWFLQETGQPELSAGLVEAASGAHAAIAAEYPTAQSSAPHKGERPAIELPSAAAPASRGGLNRRLPGRHLVAFDSEPSPPVDVRRDPAAEKDQLDAYSSGAARAAVPQSRRPVPEAVGSVDDAAASEVVATPPGAGRGGLPRRMPGAHLAASVDLDAASSTSTSRALRDPEAERDALDSYVAGLARASQSSSTSPR